MKWLDLPASTLFMDLTAVQRMMVLNNAFSLSRYVGSDAYERHAVTYMRFLSQLVKITAFICADPHAPFQPWMGNLALDYVEAVAA